MKTSEHRQFVDAIASTVACFINWKNALWALKYPTPLGAFFRGNFYKAVARRGGHLSVVSRSGWACLPWAGRALSIRAKYVNHLVVSCFDSPLSYILVGDHQIFVWYFLYTLQSECSTRTVQRLAGCTFIDLIGFVFALSFASLPLLTFFFLLGLVNLGKPLAARRMNNMQNE